jgi:hypothetical protein
MTDLEKFKQLFDSMNIEYLIDDTYYVDYIVLNIADNHVYQSYCNKVRVHFDKNGKFVEFQGWGE